MVTSSVRITSFRPELATAFARLSRAWIEAMFTLEPAEAEYLADPERHIVRQGGEIFFALEREAVLGTCAAIPHGDHEFELAKLAVIPEARGRGLGRALAEAVLQFARARGARRVMLVSSSRLEPALALYRSMGFQARPFPGPRPYGDADIYMEMDLV
jgi:ribosomal protein S18 acetylase RimI-like enzyme